ncbi:hypothetical protein EPD60_00340 [Flaviaesturariibacter flavus]|uniref:Iminophenyl-pyruvate dimer synthase domain-containing protein n=1 Tax=Flaviaesturariibacter flavus TaxID=2502780 RepID=A0A4R1BQN7_9BACT|nr:ferritin-like protein [Flaviaesturariibacter flavus]TCJ19607.1 hypothetical protein EPD60_00340 [Flaviaesturariibacter flavus]
MSPLFQNNNPQRHKLTPSAVRQEARAEGKAVLMAEPAGDRIETIEDLREELQDAMQLELSTIPPYLTALYSIREGANSEAVRIIRSVVVEEMLHLIMVANLINAVGGKPDVNKAAATLSYPTALPRIVPDFEVGLLPFSREAIKTFMRIELPQPPKEMPEGLLKARVKRLYPTIGAFYEALREAIERLEHEAKAGNPEDTIFTGDPKLQVQAGEYYGSGGQIVPVYDLAGARLVIDEIEGQGEGIDGTILDGDHIRFGEGIEYAHYFRFKEIDEESYYREHDHPAKPTGGPLRVDWNAVYPLLHNPTMKQYERRPEVFALAQSFNQAYTDLIANINLAVNGKPEKMQQSIALMYELRYKAIALMNVPVDDGRNAAPTFEIVDKMFQ